MLQGPRSIIYGVKDVAAARDWYSKALGFPPYFDQPFYVGFSVGGYELGLYPGVKFAAAKSEGVVAYWGVDDVPAEVARLVALGATLHDPVHDVGEGIVMATVLDPFGNLIGLIYNPHFKADA